MSRKENIEKNMEFLIKELQKEWDVSKETKHRVTISVKDARRVRIKVQQQIADMGEMLHSQSDMSFKESMKLCRANLPAPTANVLFCFAVVPAVFPLIPKRSKKKSKL